MKQQDIIDLAREKLPRPHNKKHEHEYVVVPVQVDGLRTSIEMVKFRQEVCYPDKPTYSTLVKDWGEPAYYWVFDSI